MASQAQAGDGFEEGFGSFVGEEEVGKEDEEASALETFGYLVEGLGEEGAGFLEGGVAVGFQRLKEAPQPAIARPSGQVILNSLIK
jgi:hypothetical protein